MIAVYTTNIVRNLSRQSFRELARSFLFLDWVNPPADSEASHIFADQIDHIFFYANRGATFPKIFQNEGATCNAILDNILAEQDSNRLFAVELLPPGAPATPFSDPGQWSQVRLYCASKSSPSIRYGKHEGSEPILSEKSNNG
jgi:hypothetical protein